MTVDLPYGSMVIRTLIIIGLHFVTVAMLFVRYLLGEKKPMACLTMLSNKQGGEGSGLVVNASDTRGRRFEPHWGQTVLCLCARHIYSPNVLVIPRKRWLRSNITEKLLTGTLRIKQTNQPSKVATDTILTPLVWRGRDQDFGQAISLIYRRHPLKCIGISKNCRRGHLAKSISIRGNGNIWMFVWSFL